MRAEHRAWGLLVLAVVALSASCSDQITEPPPRLPVDLSAPWEVLQPDALGLDAGLLEAAAATAGQLPRMRSLLVVVDGSLVFERYFNGFAQDSLADVRSVTKSIVSTLAGIALERGDLPSLDQSIAAAMPSSEGPLSDPQTDITFRHLLTMTGGFQWDESGGHGDYNTWILSGDHIGMLLDRPMVAQPGTSFTYNSAAVHLLGVLLEESIGESLPDYADEHLFGPIGIGDRRWENLPGERVNGGAGLDLRPRDLARFGQLFLQEGRSGEEWVVPNSWVSLATDEAFTWSSQSGPITDLTYGYLWWVDRTREAFFAWGYGGQFIYVVPSLDLVVVTTTEWRYLSQEGGPGPITDAVLRVIVEQVVPAVALR